MKNHYEILKNYETLDKIKRKELIKKIKDKRISTARLVELEKDFKDYLDIQRNLLYLYCNTFKVG